MSMRPLAAILGLALLFPATAQAGGYGCPGGGCYRQVNTPPQYSTVTDTVVIRPPTNVTREIPAEYAMVAEKVLVSPGGKRWDVSRDAYGNVVGCWVYDPPRYATEHRRVMVSAPRVVQEQIPGVYQTRERTVMVSPGSSRWVPVGRHH